jgi:hypothetical protein
VPVQDLAVFAALFCSVVLFERSVTTRPVEAVLPCPPWVRGCILRRHATAPGRPPPNRQASDTRWKDVITRSQRVRLGTSGICRILGDSRMGAGLLQQTSDEIAHRPRPNRGLWGIGAGGILTGVAVVLSAVNAVSPLLSIALALPTAVLTIGGLIRAVIPDAWTAWRRGFKLGCEIGQQLPGRPDGPASPGENGPFRAGRLPGRIDRAESGRPIWRQLPVLACPG